MAETWTRTAVLDARERLAVLDLLNRTEVALGREAIDESRRRVVVHGGTADHWLRYDGEQLTSYAQSSGGDPVVVEMAGGGFDPELLDSLLATCPRVDWWTRAGQTPPDGVRQRTLHLLEVALPVAVDPVPAGVLMRTFDPDLDGPAWLEQNNLAFADHPEQGAWQAADLAARTREAWFDPSGFLLFEIDGRIAASCWTKVHELHPSRIGEIYVISVHPAHRGRHLGRVAVTQGLAALRRRGVSRASLFVDQTNQSALRLYERLGFELVRDDHLTRFSLG